jgi:hypothetical protein
LLDPGDLPVVGSDQARAMIDPARPLNRIIDAQQ